jgi:hypothetical protein
MGENSPDFVTLRAKQGCQIFRGPNVTNWEKMTTNYTNRS